MSTSINTLKAWFEQEDKPTEVQFAALIDSFVHKDEGDQLAISRIEGLEDTLNSFMTTQQFNDQSMGNHIDVTQNGHGFSLGDQIYNDGTNWVKAIADNLAADNDTFSTNVVVSVVNDDTFSVGSIGAIVPVDLGFSGAVSIYLSQANSGEVTTEYPESGYVQQLGWYVGGYLFFNPQPYLIEVTGSEYDQETDDFKLSIKIDGNRFIANLLVKDANTNFTVTDFVPAGLASRIDPDYMIETVELNTAAETLTHRYEATKLTSNSGSEVIMTDQMNAPGEGKRINFRTSSSHYYVDANTLADISVGGIDLEVNPAASTVVYTGTVSTSILFYADLLSLID
jgi:hypothetical protein